MRMHTYNVDVSKCLNVQFYESYITGRQTRIFDKYFKKMEILQVCLYY